MGNLVVVVGQPFLSLLADLGEIAEDRGRGQSAPRSAAFGGRKLGKDGERGMENALRASWRTPVRTRSGGRGICSLRRGHAGVACAKKLQSLLGNDET